MGKRLGVLTTLAPHPPPEDQQLREELRTTSSPSVAMLLSLEGLLPPLVPSRPDSGSNHQKLEAYFWGAAIQLTFPPLRDQLLPVLGRQIY